MNMNIPEKIAVVREIEIASVPILCRTAVPCSPENVEGCNDKLDALRTKDQRHPECQCLPHARSRN